MDNLIQDLLAYSRISRQEVVVDKVELDELLSVVEAELAQEIESRKSCLRVERPLSTVLANRLMLIQVVVNLVKIAAEAICEERPEGQITLPSSFRPGA